MIKVIDVSYHNGEINFEKVKKDGISGVIIRAGYGTNNVDRRFRENIEKVIKNGLAVGIYWFSYSYSKETARKEARKCLKVVEPYRQKITMPIFFDFEYDSYNYAKRKGITVNRTLYNEIATIFCEEIENAGYRSGIYFNKDYLLRFVNIELFKNRYKWFADLSNKNRTFDLIQYSWYSRIDGINGCVDVNYVVNKDLILNSKNKYVKTDYRGVSIVEALEKENINSTFSNRKKIAEKNNIKNYKGTVSQNIKLLELLKNGKLII